MPIQDLNAMCVLDGNISSMGNCFISQGFYGSFEFFAFSLSLIYLYACWKYNLPMTSVIPMSIVLFVMFSGYTNTIGLFGKLIGVMVIVIGYLLFRTFMTLTRN